MMDLSIIIVTWNVKEDVVRCLRSLPEARGELRLEVWVVDNGSSDGSVEAVRRQFPQVHLIANPQNLGFARANNQALRQARGRYILLLNPDTVVHEGALERMVRFMDRHPQVGVLGPQLLNPDGSLQYSCRRFPSLGAMLFRGTWLGDLVPRTRFEQEYLMADWPHDEPREVDWVSGAAMVVRRAALREVGPLDERFFMYCEDMDWCARFWERGWKVMYFPGAQVTHFLGRSSRQRSRRAILEFHRSMFLYFQKHFAPRWGRWSLLPAALWLILRALYVLLLPQGRSP